MSAQDASSSADHELFPESRTSPQIVEMRLLRAAYQEQGKIVALMLQTLERIEGNQVTLEHRLHQRLDELQADVKAMRDGLAATA